MSRPHNEAQGHTYNKEDLEHMSGLWCLQPHEQNGWRGSENPEPERRHLKLQDPSSLDHMDSFPKEEGAQIRDFPRPSDLVEID